MMFPIFPTTMSLFTASSAASLATVQSIQPSQDTTGCSGGIFSAGTQPSAASVASSSPDVAAPCSILSASAALGPEVQITGPSNSSPAPHHRRAFSDTWTILSTSLTDEHAPFFSRQAPSHTSSSACTSQEQQNTPPLAAELSDAEGAARGRLLLPSLHPHLPLDMDRQLSLRDLLPGSPPAKLRASDEDSDMQGTVVVHGDGETEVGQEAQTPWQLNQAPGHPMLGGRLRRGAAGSKSVSDLLDPKRVKRLMGSRQAVNRSKERKVIPPVPQMEPAAGSAPTLHITDPNTLRQRISDLQKDNEALNAFNSAAPSQVSQLQAELNNLIAQNADLTAQLHTEQTRLGLDHVLPPLDFSLDIPELPDILDLPDLLAPELDFNPFMDTPMHLGSGHAPMQHNHGHLSGQISGQHSGHMQGHSGPTHMPMSSSHPNLSSLDASHQQHVPVSTPWGVPQQDPTDWLSGLNDLDDVAPTQQLHKRRHTFSGITPLDTLMPLDALSSPELMLHSPTQPQLSPIPQAPLGMSQPVQSGFPSSPPLFPPLSQSQMGEPSNAGSNMPFHSRSLSTGVLPLGGPQLGMGNQHLRGPHNSILENVTGHGDAGRGMRSMFAQQALDGAGDGVVRHRQVTTSMLAGGGLR